LIFGRGDKLHVEFAGLGEEQTLVPPANMMVLTTTVTYQTQREMIMRLEIKKTVSFTCHQLNPTLHML